MDDYIVQARIGDEYILMSGKNRADKKAVLFFYVPEDMKEGIESLKELLDSDTPIETMHVDVSVLKGKPIPVPGQGHDILL